MTCNCTHRRRLTIPASQICFVSAHTQTEKKKTHIQTNTHTHTLAHTQVDNTWHTNLFCERKLLVGREERPEDHDVTSQAMKNVRDNGEIRNTIRGEGSTTLYTAHIVYCLHC